MSDAHRLQGLDMPGWMGIGASTTAGMCGFLGAGIVHPMKGHIGATLTMTITTMAGICMKVTGIVRTTATTTGTRVDATTSKTIATTINVMGGITTSKAIVARSDA